MAKIISFEKAKEKRSKKEREARIAAEQGISSEQAHAAFQDLLSQVFGGISAAGESLKSAATVVMHESKEELRLHFQLKGLLKEEVKVRIVNDHLVLDVYRADSDGKTVIDPSKAKPGQLKKALSQKIPLPVPVEEEDARAEFRPGELVVYLKKKHIPEPKGTEIPLTEFPPESPRQE